jgi:hypothetical protein
MKDPIAIQHSKQAPQNEGKFEAEGLPEHVVTNAADALAQLHRLLDDYAPSWYEKRHQQKVEHALRKLRRL